MANPVSETISYQLIMLLKGGEKVGESGAGWGKLGQGEGGREAGAIVVAQR